MSDEVKPIPEGYHSVTPYLFIEGAADAIEFYQKAFGAVERVRMPGPEGRVMHAEIQIGDSVIMLSDEYEPMGARQVRPMEDQFYGDRNGTLEDPFGFQWGISTHIEDLTPEEIAVRAPGPGG